MKCRWLAVPLCLWAGPIPAETGNAGRAVFEGLPDAPGHVVIGSDTVATARFPCRSCHRRDGRGGGEGDAPAIDWETLARPSATRPAYDAAFFARLLASGKTPSGREISRLMPRYALDDGTVQSLIAHLSALTAEQKTGIHPDRIVFGVPLADHNAPSGQLLIQALETALAAKMPTNGLFGRRIEIRALRGDGATILDHAKTKTIAVLSPPPSADFDLSAFSEAGVPVLFPIKAVSETEDPVLVQSLYAAHERVVDLLLRKAVADGCEQIAISAATPAEAADVTARNPSHDMTGRTSSEDSADCVLIVGGRVTPEVLDAAEKLYVPSGNFGDLHIILGGFHGKIIVGRHESTALDLAAIEKIGPIQAHATLIAATLLDALTSAGRDLTRASLTSEVASVSRPDLGLTFSSKSPAGSNSVVFQVFETGRKTSP